MVISSLATSMASSQRFEPGRAVWAATVAAVVAAFAGCKTLDVQPLPDTANPSDEITATEARFSEVEDNQGAVLAPESFAAAKEALDDAKELRAERASNADILEKVAVANANLKRADDTIVVAMETIPAVMEARQDAIAAKAPELLREDFEEADRALEGVTEDLEDGDRDDAARKREELTNNYIRLQVVALTNANLDPATRDIAVAKREGASDLAKRTLSSAEQALEDAKAFIATNRNDAEGIASASALARSEAAHLVTVTREANAIGGNDPESIVLERERSQKLTAAAEAEARAAEERAAATEGDLAETQTEAERLAADKAFNDKFAAAQASFSAEEGEVYRQGNSLVLRLRGLSFASGKSEIQEASFPLLEKVQTVISQFAPAKVTVEGHTDSVGAPSFNQKLSEARAQAVVAYLTENGGDDEAVEMSAQGFGDQRPLAPNNTAEGRAQNRRVDVVIEPVRDEAVTH
jgi:outer membrane protein OmpA-like peptidoglycan-associated protein